MIRPVDILARTVLLAQEHLRVDNVKSDIPLQFTRASVGLIVNPAFLEYPGFRTALETLRVLLAGMCVPMCIEVRGPSKMARLGPPFSTGDWLDAMAEYRSNACAPLQVGRLDSSCTVRIALGVPGDKVDFQMAADEKSSWLSNRVSAQPTWSAATVWSGAMSAVLASAEVYKQILASLGAAVRQDDDLVRVRDCVVTVGSFEASSARSPVVIVSAGAITNAALFLLARTGLKLDCEIWDDDYLQLDNFNRYPLFTTSQLGKRKVQALADAGLPNIAITPVARRFDREAETFAATYIVGADRVEPRWEVARRRPATVVVGSTDHYMTLDSVHKLGDGGCPACLHANDDGVDALVPTVSFVSFAAGLEVAKLTAESATGGSRYALTRTWLRPDVELSRVARPLSRNVRCPVRCVKPPSS